MATGDTSVSEEKSRLRARMRKQLGAVPEASVRIASEKVRRHLAENFVREGSTVAVFSPRGPEIDLRPLHRIFPRTRFAYPLCHRGGRLTFHLVAGLGDLRPGTLGIPEPVPGLHPEASIRDIDLFLCPGLAFGRDGSRLGHGAGYYDRALEKKSPRAQAWGIGMDMQLLDRVPHDTHDQLLDGVVTESGFTRATPG